MSPPPSQPNDEPRVALTADDILDALDPEQRQVAASPSGPMCVLAGAGTGKTRAITHRIAYGVHSGAYQPQRVLAVTFTARAAGEMRTRLRELGVPGVQADVSRRGIASASLLLAPGDRRRVPRSVAAQGFRGRRGLLTPSSAG